MTPTAVTSYPWRGRAVYVDVCDVFTLKKRSNNRTRVKYPAREAKTTSALSPGEKKCNRVNDQGTCRVPQVVL